MNLFDISEESKQEFRSLNDIYFIPPFSVINSMLGKWQNRRKWWINKGIKSELGRDIFLLGKSGFKTTVQTDRGGSLLNNPNQPNTSIFDPVLCEIMYNWFAPKNANILDPFAGGSVRGIVGNYLGHKYTGIELRQKQVDSNRNQSIEILDINNQPQWYVGDSDKQLDKFKTKFNFLFSCPPYLNLEKYSDLEDDISNMPEAKFYKKYDSIIRKSINLLEPNSIAVFVVGDVRHSKGYYRRFPDKTKDIFEKYGMKLINEIIFYKNGSAALKAKKSMDYKKVVKIHQNILVFQNTNRLKKTEDGGGNRYKQYVNSNDR